MNPPKPLEPPGADDRSTRAQIVARLRRERTTVDALARAVGLTDNAVRAHLAALERDGIIRSSGVRRGGGVGKPATIYEVAPEAEPGFSRAYLPFLTTLLEALGGFLAPAEVEALMRDVGRRLAASQPPGPGGFAKRVAFASELLNALGGLTSVEPSDAALVIRGVGCPLSVAVARRSEVCLAVQTLVEELTGAAVEMRCDREGRACCCFKVTAA